MKNLAPSLSLATVTFTNPEKLFNSYEMNNITISNQVSNSTLMQLQVNSSINVAKVVEVQFLSDGKVLSLETLNQSFTLQFTIDPVTVNALSNLSFTPRCMYWNETLNQWKTNGCETSFVGGSIRCHCNHTTKFSSFVEFTPNSVGNEVATNLMLANIIISSILSMYILLVLLLLVLTNDRVPTRSRWLLLTLP